MADPFVGEIRLLGFNFPPSGWAFCDGSLLAITQNEVLFALLGTQYGGNGVTTFALPDLRSRVPVGQGQGPGLSEYVIGELGGQEAVTLTQGQLPSHSHAAVGTNGGGDAVAPIEKVWSADAAGGIAPYSSAIPDVQLAPSAIGFTGSGFAHGNLPPLLAINFSIALFGIFPSRN
jgi:microcystin-dependent protein